MWWLFQRKETPVDRRRSLDAIPVRNEGVFVDDDTDEPLELIVVRKRGEGFLSRFQPRIMEKRIKLDELGAFVFQLVDGKTTTRQIIDAFQKKYQVTRREAELSCVEFLKSLAGRGAISIAVK